MDTMKYPIGIQDFEFLRQNGYVYVDKTRLIYDMVTSGKIYFLSRPRRFGKSLLLSTLDYYFQGRRDLFRGLAIDTLEKDWVSYPVLHIDFNGNDYLDASTLADTLENNISSWEEIYGKSPNARTFGDRFTYVLAQAHVKTGHRVVVLVDEYDKPLLDVLDTSVKVQVGLNEIRLEDYNRNVLKGFYSVFKKADKDLQFVMLTGVTKFSQVSVFSGFNQPEDISMNEHYEALCGITTEELMTCFGDSIVSLAKANECSKEEMMAQLKRHYDGYHFSRQMVDVYNPFSLLNAFKSGYVDDYWFKSGTPTYLIRLLSHTEENMDEITGKYYPTEEFIDYKADTESPLPMIYQSGYLTVKGYNRMLNAYLLDYPNDEVKKGFVTMAATSYFQLRRSPNTWVFDIVEALERADLDKVQDLFTSFLASIPYSMRRKDTEREKERYFHYTFYLIMRMISIYAVYTEKQQSQGRADCILETNQDVFIFEFKLDGTADEALQQIEAKGYARPYISGVKAIHKIGASFSSETGTIEEWKVKED